jgi:hypothetical protein
MTARAGDLIVVESERVAQAARKGVIEEVLQERPARFRVRWEDGHTSSFTPSAGAAKTEAPKRRARPNAGESAQANATRRTEWRRQPGKHLLAACG